MNSERIAVLSGIIGVLAFIGQGAPSILTSQLGDALLEQGSSSGIPTFGTVGTTVLLYDGGIAIAGGLLMIVPAVGLGYYVGQQLDLNDEYQRFFKAIIAGTTVPLIALWAIGVGAAFLGIVSWSSLVMTTVFVVRLLVTVSLSTIISIFAGAALAHFVAIENTLPRSNKVNTDTSSAKR
jgi:hypothetical protein